MGWLDEQQTEGGGWLDHHRKLKRGLKKLVPPHVGIHPSYNPTEGLEVDAHNLFKDGKTQGQISFDKDKVEGAIGYNMGSMYAGARVGYHKEGPQKVIPSLFLGVAPRVNLISQDNAVDGIPYIGGQASLEYPFSKSSDYNKAPINLYGNLHAGYDLRLQPKKRQRSHVLQFEGGIEGSPRNFGTADSSYNGAYPGEGMHPYASIGYHFGTNKFRNKNPAPGFALGGVVPGEDEPPTYAQQAYDAGLAHVNKFHPNLGAEPQVMPMDDYNMMKNGPIRDNFMMSSGQTFLENDLNRYQDFVDDRNLRNGNYMAMMSQPRVKDEHGYPSWKDNNSRMQQTIYDRESVLKDNIAKEEHMNMMREAGSMGQYPTGLYVDPDHPTGAHDPAWPKPQYALGGLVGDPTKPTYQWSNPVTTPQSVDNVKSGNYSTNTTTSENPNWLEHLKEIAATQGRTSVESPSYMTDQDYKLKFDPNAPAATGRIEPDYTDPITLITTFGAGAYAKGLSLADAALVGLDWGTYGASSLGRSAGKLGLNALKNSTESGILSNTRKLNPWAENLNNPFKSYRVAGMDAARDFQNTGVLRSVTPPTPEGASLLEKAQHRPTSFPSFQKGYADMRYLPEEGGVVFETGLPTYKRGEINPVTGFPIKGRHYAHRVINPETGATMTEIPGENIRMFGDKPHWLKGYPEIPKVENKTILNQEEFSKKLSEVKSEATLNRETAINKLKDDSFIHENINTELALKYPNLADTVIKHGSQKPNGFKPHFALGGNTDDPTNPEIPSPFPTGVAPSWVFQLPKQKTAEEISKSVIKPPTGWLDNYAVNDNTAVNNFVLSDKEKQVLVDAKGREEEKKRISNQGTIRETVDPINPNNSWMLGAGNVPAGSSRVGENFIVNNNLATQATGLLGSGVVKALANPLISAALNTGFFFKGVHEIPRTVQTVADPNIPLWDKTKAVGWNALDLAGSGRIIDDVGYIADQAFKTAVNTAPAKSVLYRLASQDSGAGRDFNNLIEAIKNKPIKYPYTGHFINYLAHPELEKLAKERNLLDQYFYNKPSGLKKVTYEGDAGVSADLPAFELFSDIKNGVEMNGRQLVRTLIMDNYTNKMSKVISPELNSKLQGIYKSGIYNLEDTHANEVLDELFKVHNNDIPIEFKQSAAKTKGYTMDYNPIFPKDNIAKHMGFLKKDPVTNKVRFVTRDKWAFEPKAYKSGWLDLIRNYDYSNLGLLTKTKQVLKNKGEQLGLKAVHNAGKPFILTQTNPLNFDPINLKHIIKN